MKIISLITSILNCVYFSSADPNLFGSKKRREGKANIAGEFKSMAGETQKEIDELKTQNPFESAAAKSAMTKASRNAKQMQKRMFNTMGAGASPEAIIGAQGAMNEAVGATTGAIAVGAEAHKKQELAQLRGEKAGQMGAYGQMQSSSEDERGSGWQTLFQGIDALGSVASGIGQGIGVFSQ